VPVPLPGGVFLDDVELRIVARLAAEALNARLAADPPMGAPRRVWDLADVLGELVSDVGHADDATTREMSDSGHAANDPADERRTMTTQEVAVRLGVSRRQAQRFASRYGFRSGGRLLVARADVERVS